MNAKPRAKAPLPPDPGRRRSCAATLVSMLGAGTLGARTFSRLGAGPLTLLLPLSAGTPSRSAHAATPAHAWAAVRPGTRLAFPADHGAHPDHRTEWWYLTGWLRRPDGREAGFQVTFFRTRTIHPQANPSRFAPTQLILAHAAVALPERTDLLHAERAARAAMGLAGAQVGDTRVWLGAADRQWRLERDPATDRYHVHIDTDGFALTFALAPDGPPLLQGDAGYSRKGQSGASHYYSRPQLAVTGSLALAQGAALPVTGRAWFDHEWSSDLLDPGTIGWDWVGLNLDDGTAVMAFRLRDAAGGETWRDGTLRAPSGDARTGLAPVFTPIRTWRSIRSGATYPVGMQLDVAGRRLTLHPMLDDQELDTRASTGTIYWEGAVLVHEAGRRIGQGHMELTGYAAPIRF